MEDCFSKRVELVAALFAGIALAACDFIKFGADDSTLGTGVHVTVSRLENTIKTNVVCRVVFPKLCYRVFHITL